MTRSSPTPAQRGRVRTAASPYPPDLSWWAVKGRQTLISRVHLLVPLTGPTSSGSADASRRCRGCSHPHQRLLDRAAPSFTQPLRRPGDEGLSPPFDFRRLVAHMILGPVVTNQQQQHSHQLLHLPSSVELSAACGRSFGDLINSALRHDIPAAITFFRPNRRGHDLKAGLHVQGMNSAHSPAATGHESGASTRPAVLIRDDNLRTWDV